jgi:hypothetical protein
MQRDKRTYTHTHTQHKVYKSKKQRREKRIPCLVESCSQPTSIHTHTKVYRERKKGEHLIYHSTFHVLSKKKKKK